MTLQNKCWQQGFLFFLINNTFDHGDPSDGFSKRTLEKTKYNPKRDTQGQSCAAECHKWNCKRFNILQKGKERWISKQC